MPEAGQRVGEYILFERVGGGAFGEVWRAGHHAWAGRVVAVKIPTDPRFALTLQREGVAARGLDHPNVVAPIGIDPYADPPYLAMPFVPGENLRDVIRRGPVPPADAVAILRQVLAGLGHAHVRGVVHRDVKPENILVDRSVADAGGLSAPGAIRVTDFGLGMTPATGDGGPAAADRSILLSLDTTGDGSLVGTMRYMAPEQLDGERADARADLYACGVVLFEMLTGRRPAGLEVPSELNPAVPTVLDAAYRNAVARRERRFATAEAFAAALDGAVAAPPPEYPPVPQLRAQMASALRWAYLIALFAFCGIALLVGLKAARTAAVATGPTGDRYDSHRHGPYDRDDGPGLSYPTPPTRPSSSPAEVPQPVLPPPLPPPPIVYPVPRPDVLTSRPTTTLVPVPPARAPSVPVVNEADAFEGQAVADEVARRYPEAVEGAEKLRLVKVHDGADFRRHAGRPQPVDGSYSANPAVGRNDHILFWGVFEPLAAGRYLIVYRVRTPADTGDVDKACFLDVCKDAVTIAQRRPSGRELAPNEWRAIPVEMTLTRRTTVEYRLWPHGRTFALDRVYVFRVEG